MPALDPSLNTAGDAQIISAASTSLTDTKKIAKAWYVAVGGDADIKKVDGTETGAFNCIAGSQINLQGTGTGAANTATLVALFD